jgi:bifunctional DNA-binding transcriptional regulator/antitoxin component of YhaV-PrlF toxin-antitoxin module
MVGKDGKRGRSFYIPSWVLKILGLNWKDILEIHIEENRKEIILKPVKKAAGK